MKFDTNDKIKLTMKHHNKRHTMAPEKPQEQEEKENSSLCCFFCAMKQTNPHLRSTALASFFLEMPYCDDESHVLVMSSLWSVAMTHPDDPELPSAGALRCMSLLIAKSLADPPWLLRHQNIYIPYYAAHVIGSYTIRSSAHAELAVDSGVIPHLLDLLRGRLGWVEQRVAARALGHLASYDATFHAMARYSDKVIPVAIHTARVCLKSVYTEFISNEDRKQYHRDLLTRGIGGPEMEDRKAEEWASQLQCWSLHLLSCFASRDKSSHGLICRETDFLKELCKMWGGMVNGVSPAGVGLMRILCRSQVGRETMAACPEVIQSLCNIARSSDDWQYMGIDCLLLLHKDSSARSRVVPVAAPALADLVELQSLGTRAKLGSEIIKAMLSDFNAAKAPDAIKNLCELEVERRKREEAMHWDELQKKQAAAAAKRQQGKKMFYSGDIKVAAELYTEALELCPLRRRKERLVLYSNRAQCWLLLRDAEAAVSDATRALCLSSPANAHGKSLWRRSQAYDMKGMAKESLMDCIMFVNVLLGGKKVKNGEVKVPYYAARMISKQMNAAGLFAGVVAGGGGGGGSEEESRMKASSSELSRGLRMNTIGGEAWSSRRREKKGKEKVEEEERS